MTAERKQTQNDINTLNQIVHLLNHKKKTFIEQSSEDDFNSALDYVNKTIAKLEDKRQKLPIGHRYTGVFYLKKPYTIPSEAVKIKGSAFLREDLVRKCIFIMSYAAFFNPKRTCFSQTLGQV